MPKAAVVKKRKAANGYKLAEPLPLGEILKDIFKKEWKLGPSIGQGGFGEIYSAKEVTSKGSQYPYVIKIEPHANGPLFVEMHFYMRNAKPEDVDAFKKNKGLKTFGMPLYLGSGSHEYNGEKYRFIVMEKFGKDLWKIFLENNRIFPTSTVFKIAVQILDVLEYIHSTGYVHADIKAANILMGITKETQNKQCYLVDFGLATKYSEDKDFKPNPKKAHDGTIEYLSRDAHLGVQSRRGDLEVLAYNIIQWLGCTLPWEKKLTDPNTVQKLKEEQMSSVQNLIKSCFGKKSPPDPLIEFLKHLFTLKHNTKPDYQKIRKIFISGADTLDKPFEFSLQTKSPNKRTPAKSPVKKVPAKRSNDDTPVSTPKIKKGRSRKQQVSISESSEDEKENLDVDEEMDVTAENDVSRRNKQKLNYSEDSDEEIEKPKKTKKAVATKQKAKESSEDEEENLDDDEQMDFKEQNVTTRRKQKLNYTEDSDEEPEKPKKTKKVATKQTNAKDDNLSLNGYTAAMKEVLLRKIEKDKTKGKNKKAEPVLNDMDGFNDGMKEVSLKKKERLGKKKGK